MLIEQNWQTLFKDIDWLIKSELITETLDKPLLCHHLILDYIEIYNTY